MLTLTQEILIAVQKGLEVRFDKIMPGLIRVSVTDGANKKVNRYVISTQEISHAKVDILAVALNQLNHTMK